MTSLRSQYTRTYTTPTGAYEAVVGSVPLNYQDSSGAWQPIDDTLVSDPSSGFAYQVNADSYSAEFPASLSSGPIKVSDGGQWVTFQLAGASPAVGVVAGNIITYANVLPGVTAQYAVTPVGVKETLTLASASAASDFSYSLSTSAGLSASLLSSVVSLTGTQGGLFASIDRPSVTDANNDQSELLSGVTSVLTALAHGYTLSETLNPLWLASPSRAFPVTIDPSISLANPAQTDCAMWSAQASETCSGASFSVAGYQNDTYAIRRSLAQFNTSTLPANAKVLQANWAFYTKALTGASSKKLEVFPNGQKWDNSADWSDASTNPNTTAWSGGGGGDPTGSNPVFSTTITSGAAVWNHVPITSMAQDWLDGNTANNGMVIRSATESDAGLYSWYDSRSASNQSYLDLYYTARDGDDGIQTYTSTPLTDQANLKVDPATGNVLLATTDMNVAGTGNGSTVTFKHYYNSFSAWQAHLGGTPTTSQLGTGWTTDNSLDSTVTLYDNPDGGSATVEMPGGVPQVFTRTTATGSFNAPAGVDGDLTHDDTAHTTKFVDHNSGLTYHWTGTSGSSPTSAEVDHLSSITTAVGNTISFNNTGSDEQVTDTKGRVFDENQGPAYSGGPNVLQNITDEHGNRSVSFGYNNSGQLTSYTDATGAVTDYGYDSNGMLDDIKDPSTGHETQLTYWQSGSYAGKVESITQSSTTDCSGNAQTHVSTYTYNGNPTGGPANTDAETTVTDPFGLQTNYYWDTDRRVLQTVDPAGHTQSNTYDSTSGQISSFTDNVSSASTTLQYDTQGQISSSTEPNTDSHANNAAKVDNRSDDTASDSGYQGPARLPLETTDAEGRNTYYTIPTQGNPNGGVDEVTKVSKNITGSTNDVQTLTYNSASSNNGTVATVTDSNGNTTTYGYDSSGNLASVTPPNPRGATTYTEDADNRLHTKIDANGHTTTYSYDGDDRVTKVAFDDGTYLTYTYDTDGNLTQRRNRNGSIDTITYDALNRPTAQTYNGENESFCYNADSKLTSLTTAGGTVTYTYNGGTGYLEAVGEPGSSNCAQYNTGNFLPAANSGCIAVAMNGDNNPTAIGYPGGVLRTISYLNSGKTSEIAVTKGTTTYQDLHFYYYQGGCSATSTAAEDDQLQCTKDTAASPNVSTTYNYDNEHRLTGANNVETSTASNPSTQNESWNLDNEGNITEYSAGSTNTYYDYNNDDELCWSGTTNGSSCGTTPSGDTSYNYNADGDMNGASNGFSATYDAADVTTALNNITNGGSSDTATYADYGQTDPTTLGATSFTNSILGLASTGTGPNGQRIDYTRLPTGQLLSMRVGTIPPGGMSGYNPAASTNSYYSMVDQNNSVLGLTDATGSIDAQYRYNPYGQLLASNGSAASTNPNRWDGAYYDPDQGLYHLGARYYSPSLQRFLSPDPKTHQLDPLQQDTYSYAGGDPIDNTDPTGEFDLGEVLGGVATIVGADTVATFALGISAVLAPETTPELGFALEGVVGAANAGGIGLIAAGS